MSGVFIYGPRGHRGWDKPVGLKVKITFCLRQGWGRPNGDSVVQRRVLHIEFSPNAVAEVVLGAEEGDG